MPPFRSVNTPQASDAQSLDDMPTTSPISSESNDAPQPPTPQSQPLPSQQPPDPSVDEATTPTRANFPTGGMAAQRPLPNSPFPDLAHIAKFPKADTPKRNDSQRSRKSRDSADMDMDDSDVDVEHSGSPGDSGNDSGNVPNKKKKTQRFFCTDFPPCTLSFTRSEHLARHIRKHTGERPFMCHCNRRFSRLDNLRQHAQTVHQNEEIPIDSPAAVGTRFQKQVRTDKMRQTPGGRSRASTAGSTGSVGRGHQKSLSTSILGSMGPTFGTNEGRPRPPALALPGDHRPRYSHEALPAAHDGYMRGPPSPVGYHTPPSASFSTGPNSPGWASGAPSSMPPHSRSHSMYSTMGDRTPGRRLSQPTSPHPFMLSSPSRQLFAPDRNPPYSPSGDSSFLSSPTTPTSGWSRRESISSLADDAYRRRTWHPDTRDFAGSSRIGQVVSTSQMSRLSQVISTAQLNDSPVPPPLADPDRHQQQQQQQQPQRLPGIESFDNPQPPSAMVGRPPSPMMIDSGSNIPRTPGQAPLAAWNPADEPGLDPNLDPGLNNGLTRLHINQPPRDSAMAWANEASQAVLAQADQVRTGHAQPAVRFEPETGMSNGLRPSATPSRHQHTMSAPINMSSDLSSRDKRRAWFGGPPPTHWAPATIHEGRAQERTVRSNIVHPNMNGFRGFPARNDGPILHQTPRVPPVERGHAEAGYQGATYQEAGYQERRRREPPSRDDMRALDALVAVATNEASAASQNEKFQDRDHSRGWSSWNNAL